MASASPASVKMGHAGSMTGSPKPFSPGLVPKQERALGTGSILNLNLGESHLTPPPYVAPYLVLSVWLGQGWVNYGPAGGLSLDFLNFILGYDW